MMLSPSASGFLEPRKRKHDDQLGYFMLKPPACKADEIQALCRKYRLPRKHEAGRLHQTLVPLGDMRMISPETFQRILLAAASLRADPFLLTFNRIKDNALTGIGMRSLCVFQKALVQRLLEFGVELPDYAFRPHISLVYGEWERRNIPIDPISWHADEFLLINSIHGKGHDLLGRWALDRQGGFGF